MLRPALLAIGAVVFCVLVLLNVGGYRFGVSDQAFYVPVVLHGLDPGLYPHDASLMAAQDRFLLFDDWLAPFLHVTGVSVPVAFLIAYGLTLVLLYGAAVRVGRALCGTWWGVAGLVFGLTLRHQVPDTGANTLESYFHPRLLAFAIGLSAVGVFLRGRTWPALVIVGLAFCVHPTTAGWFAIWIGTAALISDRQWRGPLVGLAVTSVTVAALAVAGPLRNQLAVMDAAWVDLVAVKDYLIAAEWPWLTWIGNLVLAAIIASIYRYRRALGVVSPRETGLVIGCGVLLALFLLSVPLSAARVALAVQMQFSRIFWLLDVFASCYVVWLLVESPLWSHVPVFWPRARRAVVVALAAVAVARGSYVMLVERAGQPLVRAGLATTDWTRVMTWAATQPVGTHFLADPSHASRYGSSVRVASGRDVYLEETKDIAIAIYSSAVALEITRRLADLGDFATLDAGRAISLADRYDLDYLIIDRFMDLPVAHQRGDFSVYALRPQEP